MNEYILEQTADMNLIEWLDYNKQLNKKIKKGVRQMDMLFLYNGEDIKDGE